MTPVAVERAARIAHIVELARAGQSFEAIGAALFFSRERVRQLAKQGGLTGRDLAGVCQFCGEPLLRRLPSRYGIHACLDHDCQVQRKRAFRRLAREGATT